MRIALSVLAMLFACATLSAQYLSPLFAERIEWSISTRRTLLSLYPSRVKLVKRLELIRPEVDVLGALGNSEKLAVTAGLVRTMKDPDEYKAVIAHEMTHALLLHSAALTDSFSNWSQERTQELSADFGSVIVSRNPKAVLTTLDRMIPFRITELANSPAEYRLESARVLFLRRTSLEEMLRRTFHAIGQSRPLPGPVPSKNASLYVWETYAERVLLAMYPAYSTEIRGMLITTATTPEGGMIYSTGSEEHYRISFSPSRLATLGFTKEEFAVVMGHEFGHFLVGSAQRKAFVKTGIGATPEEHREREEAEADLVGTLPILEGECHLARAIRKITKKDSSLEPELHAWNQNRILRLKRRCAYNR